MKAEEKYFLPVAAELLTKRDWSEIESKVGTFKDPLGSDAMKSRFSVLNEKLAATSLAAAS